MAGLSEAFARGLGGAFFRSAGGDSRSAQRRLADGARHRTSSARVQFGDVASRSALRLRGPGWWGTEDRHQAEGRDYDQFLHFESAHRHNRHDTNMTESAGKAIFDRRVGRRGERRAVIRPHPPRSKSRSRERIQRYRSTRTASTPSAAALRSCADSPIVSM